MARKRRDLAPEEKELWRRVAKSVSPMHPRAPTNIPDPSAQDPSKAAPSLFPPDMSQAPAQARTHPSQASLKAAATAPAPRDLGRRQSAFAIDPTSLRNIRRGKRRIDATIDLHGLFQDQAFRTLEVFLAAQRAKGARLVVVVTGKGARRSHAGRHDQEAARSAPGVLRRSAPGWLAGPFARHVAGFSTAGPRHGGEGAFYVLLRKPEGG